MANPCTSIRLTACAKPIPSPPHGPLSGTFSNPISFSTFRHEIPTIGFNLGRKASFALKVEAKKGIFDDPFNYGEDPDKTYGDLLSTGKQTVQEPRPASDPSSSKGYLEFPKGYLPEIASLGLYIRDDVRKCVILASGGVYENLLLFPVIQLLKEKYPGVKIDVAANARGKQTYEINKNIRRAWVYPIDDQFVSPASYTEFVGKLKNENYDLVLSTRQTGLGHGLTLFLTDARQRVSYVMPNVNGAGADVFLSASLKADREVLADAGYNMYKELVEFLSKPVRDIERLPVPDLEIAIPRKVREVVRNKYESVGLKAGAFTVVHGVESPSLSQATMRSQGDEDSSLSIAALYEISKSTNQNLLIVVPNAKDSPKIIEVLGEDARVVQITTPGQLAALIDESSGVITSNTAAVQLAMALKKQSVALFGSEEKSKLFAPKAAEKKCITFFSQSGKLSDIDLDSVSSAVKQLGVLSYA